MHSLTICLIFLFIFIHNATPKIYVIDLTNDSHEDDTIKLDTLLELLKEPEENRFKEIKPDKQDHEIRISDKAADLKKGEKTLGRESIYYPNLYHEFYTERPKDTHKERNIYSLYNIYGGLLKTKPSFEDLTRQEFSQDYLDLGELSRMEPECFRPGCRQQFQKRDHERKLRTKVSKLLGPNSQRRSNRLELRSYSSEDSSDSSDSDSNDRKRKKSNRFQVVFNDDSSSKSEESHQEPQKPLTSESEESPKKSKRGSSDSDSESDEVTKKPVKAKERYSYLQGNRVYDSFRRKLPQFLPKRFHWDEDDLHHLGYYWFNGPQGKNPE